MPSYGQVTEAIVTQLAETLGRNNVSESQAVLEQHGRDESYHTCMPPEVVVFPQTVDQVASVTRLCHTHHIPLVPFGTGTGLEGGIGAMKACLTVYNHIQK